MATHKLTGGLFCMRTISRKRVEEKLNKFIEALKIQMYLNHPNIAKVFGVIVEEDKVHMVMEYCEEGDLKANTSLFEGDVPGTKGLLLNLAKAVEYMHMQQIQHRDLKLENVLMSFGQPKIADFELAVYVRLPFIPRKTICGSPAYFSPEMIATCRYNKKADIWCLGIIFYEMICGKFPF